MRKKKIISLYFIVFTFFIGISFLALNKNIRNTLFSKSIGGYKLIVYHSVAGDVYNRDFKSAAKKIIKYIDNTQKFSKGKNNMLQGIIDMTELASSNAFEQKEFNELESVYLKINEITDDIYVNHVWLARSLSDNDIEKSHYHLRKALRLSKSSESAYREIVRLFGECNGSKLIIENYCKDYFISLSNGSEIERLGTARDKRNFFNGDNSIFAISLNNDFENLYSKLIYDTKNFNNYEIIFENKKQLEKFSILKKFFKTSKISIKDLIIYNDKINRINLGKIIVKSSFSYVLSDSDDELVFLSVNENNDILSFILPKIYKNIKKISLNIKVEKLPLTTNFVCETINEN